MRKAVTVTAWLVSFWRLMLRYFYDRYDLAVIIG